MPRPKPRSSAISISRRLVSGIGTDGFPCPPGCEKMIKDEAWWNGRKEKLGIARKTYPNAIIDRHGWLTHDQR